MRLSLSPPDGWRVARINGQQVAFAPNERVLLAWGWLVGLPDDARAWIDEALAVELPAGARLRRESVEETRTATGFTLTLVTAVIVDAGGGVIEARLGAFYEFLELGAVAMVRAADLLRLAEERPMVLAALRGARPSSADEIVAIEDIFEMEA